jgi:hypothetical protein
MYQWNHDQWLFEEAAGAEGEPLIHAASDAPQFRRLQVGDRLYVVGQSEEKMLLLGRMDIAQLLSEREVEAHYRELVYEARYHVIADVRTAKRFDRVVPEQVARSITSERGARIAFASGTEYRLLSSSVQPRLWLTEDSARALDRLLDSEAGPSGDRLELIADLENRKQARGRGRTARQNRAVELQGMRLATHEYERDGWKVEDVSATCSYDLLCTKRGEPDLYVEVKGSAEAQIAGVVLTRNEVALARRHLVDLAVVTGIRLGGTPSRPRATGGVLTRYAAYRPADKRLTPLVFEYQLPRLAGPSGHVRLSPLLGARSIS